MGARTGKITLASILKYIKIAAMTTVKKLAIVRLINIISKLFLFHEKRGPDCLLDCGTRPGVTWSGGTGMVW